ncbi:putative lyase [Helianthus debilis subsp. tardiflorus]
MATSEVNTTEPARPLANFPPSTWGDHFLSFSLDNSQLEAYVKAMEQPKEQLRRLILNPTTDSNEKLSMIYSVYRLGLTYLFSKDIDAQVYEIFNLVNLQTYHEADLYTISIHFQVFRSFGYRFSCGN